MSALSLKVPSRGCFWHWAELVLPAPALWGWQSLGSGAQGRALATPLSALCVRALSRAAHVCLRHEGSVFTTWRTADTRGALGVLLFGYLHVQHL